MRSNALIFVAITSSLVLMISVQPSCKKGSDPEEHGGAPTREQYGERAIAFVKQTAAAVDDNKDNCDAMVTALEKVGASAESFKRESASFENDPEASKWFDETYADELAAAEARMTAGMRACASDPRVEAAFRSLAE